MSLLIVPCYKHVGTKLAVAANLSYEVTSRVDSMRGGSLRLRKCVLRNPAIDVKKLLFVMLVYLLTKGSFQCCTWSSLPDSLYKRFHYAIMSLIKMFVVVSAVIIMGPCTMMMTYCLSLSLCVR